jgi:hypothetical protein
MSRLQLALNVNDIDAAMEFYSTLFDTAPAKRQPCYANFAIDSPALKLVLFEDCKSVGVRLRRFESCDLGTVSPLPQRRLCGIGATGPATPAAASQVAATRLAVSGMGGFRTVTPTRASPECGQGFIS